MDAFVLHIDLDQFLVAVELLRRPELRGRPVVVGGTGDPSRRGVVATASYEARRFGVHSAVPLRTARKRCPEAVFLALDMPAYKEASERVMQVLADFTRRDGPAVLEVAGWDEAYLEAVTDSPEELARAIQLAVRERTGLSCSVGVGRNKLQAKLASGLAKPAGVFRLVDENWSEVMDARPPSALPGIGRKRAAMLEEMGIAAVGALARADEGALARRFGPQTGPWLVRLARGRSDEPVQPQPPPARSRGCEETFQEDLRDPEAVRREVAALARRVAAECLEGDRGVARVVVKVRFAPFETHSHGLPLHGHPQADELQRAALLALGAFDLSRPVRLLGVRVELAAPAEAARAAGERELFPATSAAAAQATEGHPPSTETAWRWR